MIENEYGIKAKPASPGNPQANVIVERIHQVLGDILCTFNLQEIYLDEADQWMGIIAAEVFVVRSTYHTTKGGIPGQLVFGRDMILPRTHVANWRYIRQRKQTQIDNDVIR